MTKSHIFPVVGRSHVIRISAQWISMIPNTDDIRKNLPCQSPRSSLTRGLKISVGMLSWLLWPRNAANNDDVL